MAAFFSLCNRHGGGFSSCTLMIGRNSCLCVNAMMDAPEDMAAWALSFISVSRRNVLHLPRLNRLRLKPRQAGACWILVAMSLAACGQDTNANMVGTDGYKVAASSASETSKPSKKQAPKPAPEDRPGPYGQNADDYVLTFADEFENGYNPAIWNDTTWDKPSHPQKNYAVEGGMLKIWPDRDANGQFIPRVLDTDGKFYQTYGYFEIEAKLPRGKGPWPAFWLYNHDDTNGTFRPEIDIMEAYPGGGPESYWSDAKLNPTAYAVTIWTGEPKVKGGEKMLMELGDLSSKFHKYALKWEPHRQTFYFDGKEVYSAKVSMPHRMYILLDVLYGSASGDPDHTTPTGRKNAFEIKYVRAWQFKKKK